MQHFFGMAECVLLEYVLDSAVLAWCSVFAGQPHHDFPRLLLPQDEAERVSIGSGQQAEKKWLLAICQLAHVHCSTHTYIYTNTQSDVCTQQKLTD